MLKKTEVFIIMTQITKDTMLRDILAADPGNGIAEILMKSGMNCFGCPSSGQKNLEQATTLHGVDCDILVDEINSYLQTALA